MSEARIRGRRISRTCAAWISRVSQRVRGLVVDWDERLLLTLAAAEAAAAAETAAAAEAAAAATTATAMYHHYRRPRSRPRQLKRQRPLSVTNTRESARVHRANVAACHLISSVACTQRVPSHRPVLPSYFHTILSWLSIMSDWSHSSPIPILLR